MRVRAIVASFITGAIASTSMAMPSHAQAEPSLARQYQQNFDRVQLDRIKEDPRYLQTRLLCEHNWSEYGWILKESAGDVLLLGSAQAPAWARLLENKRIAPEVKDLLDSEAFVQGLRDCGTDASLIANMAGADYAGKAAGLAATYTLYRAGGPFLLRLGQMGRAGSVAQKAILVIAAAYAVRQVISAVALFGSSDKAHADTTALVDTKVEALQSNVGGMKDSLERDFRAQLATLDLQLHDPKLSPKDRSLIELKMARIRSVLAGKL